VDPALFDVTDTGIGAAIQHFRWGGSTVAPAVSHQYRQLLVYNRAITDSECVALERFFATREFINWQAALGAAAGDPSGTLVFALWGNSQAGGRGRTPLDFGARTRIMYRDGWVRTPPGSDGVIVPMDSSASAIATRPGGGGEGVGSTNAGASIVERFSSRLRELGVTEDLVFVSMAGSGTDSIDWNQFLADDPPVARFGFMCEAVKELVEGLPNAKIGGFIWVGGETNTYTTVLKDRLASDLAACCTNLDARFAGQFRDTEHYMFVNITTTIAIPNLSYPEWANVRDVVIPGLPATIVNSIQVNPPDGPWNAADKLHWDTGASDSTGLRGAGYTLANAYYSLIYT
jgi:hypothetical protein